MFSGKTFGHESIDDTKWYFPPLRSANAVPQCEKKGSFALSWTVQKKKRRAQIEVLLQLQKEGRTKRIQNFSSC